ncbi:MAG TPA: hypothetical protein VF992_08180 [Thermoplasmata archaeon]
MPETADGWSYANNWRIAAFFLGLAMILLGIGSLAVFAFGDDAGMAGLSLLAIATYLLVFSVLVFVPRIARRGSVSFSLFSRRSVEDAEKAVVGAIEAVGRAPRVEMARSRSNHPPRVVTADGIVTRFRIEISRAGPGSVDGGVWTEIVQSVASTDADAARTLRERVNEQLARLPRAEE